MLNPGNKFLDKIYDKLDVIDKGVLDDKVCLFCNIVGAVVAVAGIIAISIAPFAPYL